MNKVLTTIVVSAFLCLPSFSIAENQLERITRTLTSNFEPYKDERTPAAAPEKTAKGCLSQIEIQKVESPQPYAYVDREEGITISSGMMELADSEGELAFIVAHELAHLILGHDSEASKHHSEHVQDPLKVFTERELEADLVALVLLEDHDYRPESSLELLRKLNQFGEDEGLPLRELYPSISVRLARLTKENLLSQ